MNAAYDALRTARRNDFEVDPHRPELQLLLYGGTPHVLYLENFGTEPEQIEERRERLLAFPRKHAAAVRSTKEL